MWKVIKKIFNIVFTSILTLLVICSSYLAFDKFVMKNRVPTIFGYGFVIISLDAHSMSGMIEAGDLIIIQECEEYNKGEVITYLEDTGNNTVMIVTHLIVDVKINQDGSKEYITLGVANNGVIDTNPKIEIYGKVVDVVPQLGMVLSWVRDEGYIYILGFVLLIASSFIVFRKEKGD